MSATDKVKNKTEELGGKAEEKLGQATGNADREQRGKDDQAKANLKAAGEKVKDVFKD
ncbi:CsbD family protein [Nocardia vaccinii]|uniref:CsbD family protein n=1 Tax=Nocardia vaccinii TaxID=1822 RepID=UPI0008369CBB|nr:CsbD family protein [Nocardia vaccinii]